MVTPQGVAAQRYEPIPEGWLADNCDSFASPKNCLKKCVEADHSVV